MSLSTSAKILRLAKTFPRKLNVLAVSLWHIFTKEQVRLIVKLPRMIARWAAITRRGGLKGLKDYLAGVITANFGITGMIRDSMHQAEAYRVWVEKHDPGPIKLRELAEEAIHFPYTPLFSILMPVYNVEDVWLRKAIDSVLAQVYPHWELCIADDASTKPHVKPTLQEYGERDSRIKVLYREENGHISAATNSAFSLATGDFVCLMDHDDEISPDALFEFARLLNERPDTDMVYSDEDKIDPKGNRFEPFFKPDWSPEYLETCMYTGHFACYRTGIAKKLGGFRLGYEGPQDYDFVLRFTEQTDRIGHVPKVLYHWRVIPGSAASSAAAKSYAAKAAIKALEDRLVRFGQTGRVAARPYLPIYRIDRDIVGSPLVSIIIPSAGPVARMNGRTMDILANCISSIYKRSTYDNFEVIVVASRELTPKTMDSIKMAGCAVVSLDGPFSHSRAVNVAAARARGEYLLVLNDDTEVISRGWIEAMLQAAQSEGVGAVGAKLYYDDSTIQHGGATLNGVGMPDHVCRGFPGSWLGYFLCFAGNRNCLAVTGACLMTSKAIFAQLGGFSEEFAFHYNDVDYCLRARRAGYRIVFAADAELFHYEGKSKPGTVDPAEERLFLRTWQKECNIDPYYNVNFDRSPPRYILKV
jgi:GT2 family glycosyltransferase